MMNSYKGVNVRKLSPDNIESRSESSQELFQNPSADRLSYDQTPSNQERPDVSRFDK